jgi:hypothetical protein
MKREGRSKDKHSRARMRKKEKMRIEEKNNNTYRSKLCS